MIPQLGEPVQRASVKRKENERRVVDHAFLIVDTRAVALYKYCLVFLNHSSKPKVQPDLGTETIQRRRREGSKSFLPRSLFLFSQIQEHYPEML